MDWLVATKVLCILSKLEDSIWDHLSKFQVLVTIASDLKN